MLFNSLSFLLFFPVVCIVYFCIPSNKWRNLFLLGASYYFYMCWEPVYALLLIASTLITYFAAFAIEKYVQYKKKILLFSVIANLSILFFFKYFNWVAEDITYILDQAGLSIHIPEFRVLLPVGISFYTFQALGYLIDVYRGDIKAEKNVFIYALFVSFFPQLVAGPIERSRNLLPQFRNKHSFDGNGAITGIQLMLWGFFLKLVIADRFALYVNEIYDNIGNQDGSSILLASFFFCFQLYGDFAGYSYVAIGASRVMGFRLMDNFQRPYFFSTSIQEYWKRNHISLTTWFMDYVYYPMVGSSINIYWWCFCIFFTFFLSGFWHGANWTYVMSFTIFGFYLVICMLKNKPQKRIEKKYHLNNNKLWLWSNRFLTLLLVMIALVFFRANNIEDGFTVLMRMFTDLSMVLFTQMNVQKYNLMILLMLFVIEYMIEYKKISLVSSYPLPVHICMSLFLIFAIFLLGVFEGEQFIYFQF